MLNPSSRLGDYASLVRIFDLGEMVRCVYLCLCLHLNNVAR